MTFTRLFCPLRALTLMLGLSLSLSACQNQTHTQSLPTAPSNCLVELMILGVGQDAGIPQIFNPTDPAWSDPELNRLASSVAVIDHERQNIHLFDATPDIRAQITAAQKINPTGDSYKLASVFLTHAHIGHYAGLIFLGRESASTHNMPTYAMPRMADFLKQNGPWSQLVVLQNISLKPLSDRQVVELTPEISIIPMQVPHRDEFSETVGYIIRTIETSALYLPDIDDWQSWLSAYDTDIVNIVRGVDIALLDATFFDDNELPGRDMSKIPHPRVTETLDLFKAAAPELRPKIHFIHYNHTNPIRFQDSPQSKFVKDNQAHIAKEGERHCLKSG